MKYALVIEESYYSRMAVVLIDRWPTPEEMYTISQSIRGKDGEKFSWDKYELKFRVLSLGEVDNPYYTVLM